MKRVLYSIMAIVFIAVNLTACSEGVSKTVPDSIVEVRSEEYGSWYSNEYKECDYVTCESIISHTIDAESHTDTVNFEVGFGFEYGTYIYECTDVFQYYRDSDTWESINYYEPEFLRIDWNKEKLVGQTCIDCERMHRKGLSLAVEAWTWDVTIEDIDFEDNSITLNYAIDDETYKDDEIINTVSWNDIETFYFDSIDNDKCIEIKIPCGYTVGEKSYDAYVLVKISTVGFSCEAYDPGCIQYP